MPQMAIAMLRTHLGAIHPVARIAQLVHMCRLYGLGETGPAAAGLELVGGREQRLARHDVDIDPSFLVAEILATSRALGSALLCDAILFRRQLGDSSLVFLVFCHGILLGSLVRWALGRIVSNRPRL